MGRFSVETSLGLAGIAIVLMMVVLGALSGAGSVALAAGILAASVVVAVLLRMRAALVTAVEAVGAMDALRERYQRLVDTAHEGIWLVDGHHRSSFANPKLATMFGESVGSMRGRSVYDFLGENPSGLLAMLLSSDPRMTGRTHDVAYRRADGSAGWAIASGRPVAGEDGSPAGTLLMLTDITERKQAELALAAVQVDLEVRIKARTADLERSNTQLRDEIAVREAAEKALAASEQRLHEIISAMPIALMLKDPSLRILLMNPACEDQCGVPFTAVAGTRASPFFPPEQLDAIEDLDRAAFEAGTMLSRELPVWNRVLGENRILQCYRKPVYDADGNPLLMISMGVDVTERKRIETALADSLAQLRQLTAHLESIREDERKRIALDIHDELGQNLMALKLDVSMLHSRTARHPRLNDRTGRVLETIDATIRSVRAIINDLHPSTLELGLVPAVEWLLGEFGKRSGIVTRFSATGGDGAGIGNRATAAVFRAVQESLVNVMRHAQARSVAVSLQVGARELVALIEDDGVGIDTASAAKMESFGLRGMRERFGALGGRVAVDGEAGRGTRVSITLPLASDAAQAAATGDNTREIRPAIPIE